MCRNVSHALFFMKKHTQHSSKFGFLAVFSLYAKMVFSEVTLGCNSFSLRKRIAISSSNTAYSDFAREFLGKGDKQVEVSFITYCFADITSRFLNYCLWLFKRYLT